MPRKVFVRKQQDDDQVIENLVSFIQRSNQMKNSSPDENQRIAISEDISLAHDELQKLMSKKGKK